jgi:hypothetical protein
MTVQGLGRGRSEQRPYITPDMRRYIYDALAKRMAKEFMQ